MFTTRRHTPFVSVGSTAFQQKSSLAFELSSKDSKQPIQLLGGAGREAGQQQASRAAKRGTEPQRLHPLQAFAVLTGTRLFGVRHEGNIRHTFNRIDVDQKGHITEADLAAFATQRGLPQAYVRPFIQAVLRHQQQQQPPDESPQQPDGSLQQLSDPQQLDDSQELSLAGHGPEQGVSFEAFHAFVASREAGLRQAFKAFDMDGDGLLSPSDLCCSLSRVSICCPTGCVIRPRGEVVAQLMHNLKVEGHRRLTFAEFRSFFMLLPEQDQLVEYWLSGPAALSCADMGNHFSLQDTQKERRGTPWGHLLAGAVAGAASRSATAPLETLRLAAMAGTFPAGTSLWSAAQALVSAGGVGALYKGNLVNVLRSAPARAVDFFAFDLLKRVLGGADSYQATFAAAGLAGTLSWVLLYPLEVVRSRLTLQAGAYRGIRHCMATMMAAEGPGAFYRGLGASVAAIAPEAAITYGLHDTLKRRFRSSPQAEPGVLPSLVCGVVAAWSGQLVAFPLETVSRRMQLAGAQTAAAGAGASTGAGAGLAVAAAAAAGGSAPAPAAAAHRGMLAVLASVVKEGGWGALYRGFGAATLRLVPSAMISFGAYEVIQRVWLELEAQQDATAALSHYKGLCSGQGCSQGGRGPGAPAGAGGAPLVLQAAGGSSTGCLACELPQQQQQGVGSSPGEGGVCGVCSLPASTAGSGAAAAACGACVCDVGGGLAPVGQQQQQQSSADAAGSRQGCAASAAAAAGDGVGGSSCGLSWSGGQAGCTSCSSSSINNSNSSSSSSSNSSSSNALEPPKVAAACSTGCLLVPGSNPSGPGSTAGGASA